MTSHVRRAALVQGGILMAMGALHFALPRPFEDIVPPQLPGGPKLLNRVSGAWEVATGAALLCPATRRIGGYSAAALFASVWPANFYHAYKDLVAEPSPKPAVQRKRLAYHIFRLPGQIPMIRSALTIARDA